MNRQQHSELILPLLHLAEAPEVEVVFYESIGRAVVVVQPGANVVIPRPEDVRTASRESGWDVEIFRPEELDQRKRLARRRFVELEGVTPALAEVLIGRGYYSYDDLAVSDPSELLQIGAIAPTIADRIIEQCEVKSLDAEGEA